MHIKPFSLARTFFASMLAVFSLLFLAGCEMTLTNLTPATLAENPSQIYTFSLRVKRSSSAIQKSSIAPFIIINQQSYKMNKSPLSDDLYDFDFQVPAGHDDIPYYFLVQYKVDADGYPRDRELYTEIQHAKIVRRYVLSLEVSRGPVGARVSVLGRGFTPQDVISFDEVPARTVFDSPNSLSFFVPAMSPNRNYRVTLASGAGNSPVGTFRIDPSTVEINPSSLNLHSGERTTLTFTLPYPAAQGGVLLDVTTDVPESIIMPEVVVPAGQSSVSIPVQGGKKGTGSLFLKGFGQGEITIPVSVQ